MTTAEPLALTPPPGGEILHASDRATVIWGDCRDPQVIAQVPDWYGLLCTDPPYGMNWQSSHGKNFQPIKGDDGTVDWPAILGEWVGPTGSYTRGLRNYRHVYVFGYRPEHLTGPLRLSEKSTFEMVWNKDMHGLGDLSLPRAPAHELFTFGVHIKSAKNRAGNRGSYVAHLREGTVITVPRKNSGQVTRHPTEKPVELMAQLIESSTIRGDLVVDPCAGSGSTGVAAVLEGRRCFLVEYDRGYAELAVQRVQAAERLATQMEAA